MYSTRANTPKRNSGVSVESSIRFGHLHTATIHAGRGAHLVKYLCGSRVERLPKIRCLVGERCQGKCAVLYQLCLFPSKRLEEKWHNWYSAAPFLYTSNARCGAVFPSYVVVKIQAGRAAHRTRAVGLCSPRMRW